MMMMMMMANSNAKCSAYEKYEYEAYEGRYGWLSEVIFILVERGD
jgi:hypothetical protein